LLDSIGKPNLKLSDEEWDSVDELAKFLESFRCSEALSGQKYATQNLSLLFRCELEDVLEVSSNDS